MARIRLMPTSMPPMKGAHIATVLIQAQVRMSMLTAVMAIVMATAMVTVTATTTVTVTAARARVVRLTSKGWKHTQFLP